MTIQERSIIQALEKREEYILGNLESISMKALRRVLEQDLRLERDALKPMKKVVNSFVDNLLLKTRFKGQTDEKAHQRKSHSQPRDEGMKQARNLTARFKKLRDICKQASISIPPSLYRKDNGSKDMESAILEILRRNGLDENSQKASIMAVKEQLQLERDLDGIDKGNIINDGPRSRRKAVRYAIQHSSSEGNSEDIEGCSSGKNGSEADTRSETSSGDEQGPTTVASSKRPKLAAWSDDD